ILQPRQPTGQIPALRIPHAGRARSPAMGAGIPRKRRPQRPAPVVVPPEGPAAGGGVRSTVVEPGVPLGPGLLATSAVFQGPQARTASARRKATRTATNVPRLTPPS